MTEGRLQGFKVSNPSPSLIPCPEPFTVWAGSIYFDANADANLRHNHDFDPGAAGVSLDKARQGPR